MKILGLDPSLSNWGIALCSYTSNFLSINKVDVIKTKGKKLKSGRNQDDLDRAYILSRTLRTYVAQADLVIVELPHGSQSSRAMVSYGICIGVLSQIDKPMIKVTAWDVKHVIGRIETSKEEIIAWVEERHKGVLDKRSSYAEHQADAIVAIYAGLKREGKL